MGTHNADEVVKFIKDSNAIEGIGEDGLADSVSAWGYLSQFKTQNLTLHNLLEVHRIVLRNLRPDIAGKIRDCDVTVGGRPTVKHNQVEKQLERVFFPMVNMPKESIREISDDRSIDYDNWCRKTHIDFEMIHPFEDGNGRVGRIIYNWQRKRYGLPINIIKYEERYKYYNWFSGL